MNRAKAMVRNTVRVTLVLVPVACTWIGDPSKYREVERTPSPDGQLDAVLVVDPSDATTGLYHLAFIVRHGSSLPHWKKPAVAQLEWAYRNDSTTGVNFHWRGRDTLALEFVRADRQKLLRPSVSGPNGPITVVLVRGVVDSQPPESKVARPRN